MLKSSFLTLFIATILIVQTICQTVPVYGNSPLFETKILHTAIPSTQSTSPFSLTVNPALKISTQLHRKPFISIAGIEAIQTDGNSSLFLLSQLTCTQTSFTITFEFSVIFVQNIVSWVYEAPIKFYYMLIDCSFPDVYISSQLDIISTSTNFIDSSTKSTIVNLNNWVGTSDMLTFSQTDTKFIYAITQIQTQSLNFNDNYAVNLKFTTSSNISFTADVWSVCNEKILKLKVSLFIYNMADMSIYLIKITQNYYVSPILPTETLQYQIYSSWNVYPGMQLILGLGGFQFANSPKIGFDFYVNTSENTSILTLEVKNAHSTATNIPKLEVTLFSIFQLKCPNNELFINTARTQCYITCPSGTNAGISIIPTTILKQCLPYKAVGGGTCPAGKFPDSSNNNACINCKSNCTSCTSTSSCDVCNSGFYLSGKNCQACSITGCTSCTSATTCTQCTSPFVLNSGSCVCQTGTYFVSSTSTCSSCVQSIFNCIDCSSSTICTQCDLRFYVNSSGSCKPCSSNCLTCDSTGCFSCDTGYSVFNDASFSPPLVCKSCNIVYNPQCTSCNQTQCVGCDSGYFLRKSTVTITCQALSSVICGDGDWVTEIEACDDANLNNGDGCSFDCKVQEDYICLIADQLASGASFCKYNKQFYLEFFYLEKDVFSNSVHFYFKLQPSTFNYWTQQTVETLLSPVTIVDSETGNIKTIPVNNINLLFSKNEKINQIELIVDYGSNDLEGSFFQFNLQPSLTGLASINHLLTQNNLHLKVDSEKSSFYLFNYDQEVYNFQRSMQTLGLAVGLMAFFMLILGFCVPSGKLIILQSLAVVQISYFSLLQFEKIPPTFVGLRNLVYSNGYNEPSLFASTDQGFQDVYKVMGLQSSVLSNENIGLIIFIILPALIGMIGFLVCKFFSKGQNQQKFFPQVPIIKSSPPVIEPKILEQSYETKLKPEQNYKSFSKANQISKDLNFSKYMIESIVQQIFKLDTRRSHKKDDSIIYQLPGIFYNQNHQHQQKQQQQQQVAPKIQQKSQNLNLNRIIFQRILYETIFYGIFVTSYLSWVSILHSFSHPQIINYISSGFILIANVGYGFLFVKMSEKSVLLNQFLPQQEATGKIFPQKHFVFTKFGEFSQVCTQITSLNQKNCPNSIKKIYLIYLFQRIISSLIIVFLPHLIKFTSGLLIGIFALIMIGLIIIYLKTKPVEITVNKKQKIEDFKQQPKQTIQNDLLQKNIDELPTNKIRPSIFSYLYENYILRQSINFMTIFALQILFIYANVVISTSEPSSTFVSNQFITKIIPISILGILLANMLFNLFLWVWEIKSSNILVKFKILFYSIFPSRFEPQLLKIRQSIQKIRQAERQQAQCVKMINNFMEKSTVFQSKENPFLGIEQKQKQLMDSALLDVFKIEQNMKFQIPFNARKRKSWLIQRYWDYM